MGLIEAQAGNVKFVVDDKLLYTETDEWVRVEGEVARVGITDYAQKMLRDVVGVELPRQGAKVKRGQAIVVIESIKATAEVYTPVTGTVVEVNERLRDEPELVNKDPYGGGWIVAVKMDDPKELEQLLKPQEYVERKQQKK
ncbi:MAG: glycine cleavage system protein GcvH [Desulfurococcaceae archaeon]|jgi:glycine cleavage system H protein|nr:glycine cleavage system protein GcvH [Desulfurococcaceae archaeon]